jgi:hypothetical protein
LASFSDRELGYQTRCDVRLAQARRHYSKGNHVEALKAVDDLVDMIGDNYVRCGVEGMLLSALILVDQGKHDQAGQVLEDVRSRAERHSLRDLDAKALCLLGKVRAGQGSHGDAMELCTVGIDLLVRLGHASYDCRTICADISIAAGDTEAAIAFLGPALDEAGSVYSEKCPPRMLHYFIEAKKVPDYVGQIESLFSGLGRPDEAIAYRAKFPLK